MMGTRKFVLTVVVRLAALSYNHSRNEEGKQDEVSHSIFGHLLFAGRRNFGRPIF
jgi:hypothetical protein